MRSRHVHSPLPRLRGAAGAALAASLLLALTACGDDADEARDQGSGTSSSATSDTASPGSTSSGAADDRGYPDFEPADYVYRLEVLCYCPQIGAVRIEVKDGKVVSATSVGDGRGVTKGAQAPDFARLTINDIIAIANDPTVDEVEVTWPDGQDYPSVVDVDRLANAVDDEVTYTIKAVRVR